MLDVALPGTTRVSSASMLLYLGRAIRILLAIVVCLGVTTPTLAVEDSSASRKVAAAHTETAQQAADRGDYKLAAVEYQAALSIAESFNPREPEIESDLLNNLSRVNEKLGNWSVAIEQAQRMLTISPNMPIRERDEHQGRITRMRALLGQTPPVSPKPPEPVAPAAPIAPVAPVAPRTRSSLPVGGIALTAIGGGLLIASIGCAAALPGAIDRLQGSLTLPEIDSLTSQARTLQGLAIGLGSVGALAGAGGIVWLVLWKRSH